MTLRLVIIILHFGSGVPIDIQTKGLFLSDDSSLQSASSTTTFSAALITSTTTFPAALGTSTTTFPAALGTSTSTTFPAALGTTTTTTFPAALGTITTTTFPAAFGTSTSTTFPAALGTITTTTFPATLGTNQTFSMNLSDPDYTIQSFCQHLDCPLSGENKSPLGNPCCIPCECGDACSSRGTCCKSKLNSLDTLSSSDVEKNGIEEQCFEAQLRGSSADYWPTEPKSYLLIQTCPTNTTSPRATINKCLRPKTFNLDQQIPVYRTETHRNYRNIYCAECNDDTNNITPWESKLKCKDASFESIMLSNDVNRADFDFKTTIQSLMHVNCVIEWIPVSEIVPSYCINQELIKSSCRIELFTHDVDLICREGQYAPVRTKTAVYRNLFYLACNEGDSVVENKCYDNVAYPKPFSALISLAPYRYREDYATMQTIADNCTYGFIFDELLSADELVDHKADIIDIGTDYAVIYIQITTFVTTPTNIDDALQNVIRSIDIYNAGNYSARSGPSVQLVSAAFNNMSDSYIAYASYQDSPAYWQCSVPAIAMASIQICETVFIQDYILLDDGSFETNNFTFFPGEYIARKGQFNQYEYISGFSVCYSTYLCKSKSTATTTLPTLIIIEKQSEPMVGQSEGSRLHCAGLAFMLCALIHMMVE